MRKGGALCGEENVCELSAGLVDFVDDGDPHHHMVNTFDDHVEKQPTADEPYDEQKQDNANED